MCSSDNIYIYSTGERIYRIVLEIRSHGRVKDGSFFMALGTPFSVALYVGKASVAGYTADALVSEILESEGGSESR